MRWKGSARGKLMRGLHFGKRGQAAGGEGGSNTGLKIIKVIIFLVLLPFLVVFIYTYASSENFAVVQETIVSTVTNIQDYLSPYFSALSKTEQIAGADYFGKKTNSEQDEYGYDLKALSSVSGSIIPAGSTFILEYEIEDHNARDLSIDASFTCEMVVDEDTIINGVIEPSSEISLDRSSDVYCQINGEDTEGLDDTATVYGWFNFPFETNDVELPVYFITEEVKEDLDDRDVDFFDANNLDVSESDLVVTYNGEPLSLTMGFTSGQPVVVSASEYQSLTIFGVSITNEWEGSIETLDSMQITLPAGMSFPEDKNDLPSLGCPFEEVGEFRGGITYSLDAEIRDQLFDYYFNTDEFGQAGYHTFKCWVQLEEDIVGEGAYHEDKVWASMSYTYKTEQAKESLSIVGKIDDDLLLDSIQEEGEFV